MQTFEQICTCRTPHAYGGNFSPTPKRLFVRKSNCLVVVMARCISSLLTHRPGVDWSVDVRNVQCAALLRSKSSTNERMATESTV